jgi:hypothetical protein
MGRIYHSGNELQIPIESRERPSNNEVCLIRLEAEKVSQSETTVSTSLGISQPGTPKPISLDSN